uniref:Cytochrome c oxidase assembly protein COX11 n=1 Tax=Pleurostomum flabellatum TaxID=405751 RepID=A0A7T0M424_9EUKA|nr:cytochrome c oxidase assembly protein COX11 [Pleurostomum flabellatum]QPL15612.1 cytochrome c oxidase assembly protein COX11 [Pleurostomum flabellatum]
MTFWIFLFTIQMLLFGIWNIPLFQYLCDLPVSEESIFEENSFFQRVHGYGPFLKIFFQDTVDVCQQQDNVVSLNSIWLVVDDLFCYEIFYIVGCLYDRSSFFFSEEQQEIYSNFFEMELQTSCTAFYFVEFLTLQKFFFLVPDETHLVFFRMYNSLIYNISGVSIYLIYPNEYLLFFEKIQCFCFEEIFLYYFEVVDLPVVFFISSTILNVESVDMSNKIYLSYLFLLKG